MGTSSANTCCFISGISTKRERREKRESGGGKRGSGNYSNGPSLAACLDEGAAMMDTAPNDTSNIVLFQEPEQLSSGLICTFSLFRILFFVDGRFKLFIA